MRERQRDRERIFFKKKHARWQSRTKRIFGSRGSTKMYTPAVEQRGKKKLFDFDAISQGVRFDGWKQIASYVHFFHRQFLFHLGFVHLRSDFCKLFIEWWLSHGSWEGDQGSIPGCAPAPALWYGFNEYLQMVSQKDRRCCPNQSVICHMYFFRQNCLGA